MDAPRFATTQLIQEAGDALSKQGVLLKPGVASEEFCQRICAFMDAHQADARTQFNYGGSEMRIWDSERRHPLLAAFTSECNALVSGIRARDQEAYTLLAIRNRPVPPGDNPLTRGRWHIDSLSQQTKVFLFLTETTDSTGPFEFVPSTHRPSFKARMVMQGRYLSLSDVWTGDRAYSQLEDEWVSRVIKPARPAVAVKCQPGTLMVIDTSAVHRARPCVEGARYALTAYYR